MNGLPEQAQCKSCKQLAYPPQVSSSCECILCSKCSTCPHESRDWLASKSVESMFRGLFSSIVERYRIDACYERQGDDIITTRLVRVAEKYQQDNEAIREALMREFPSVFVARCLPGTFFASPRAHYIEERIPGAHLCIAVTERDDDATENLTEEIEEEKVKTVKKRRPCNPEDNLPPISDLEAVLNYVKANPPRKKSRNKFKPLAKSDETIAKWCSLPYSTGSGIPDDLKPKRDFMAKMFRNRFRPKAPFNLERAYELLLAIRQSCKEPFSTEMVKSLGPVVEELMAHCTSWYVPELFEWIQLPPDFGQ